MSETGKDKTFCLAITSDPQYPWYDGILPSDIKHDDLDRIKENSHRQITQQYSSINQLKKQREDNQSPFGLRGLIINGDLTAFGHDWQFAKYIEQISTISSELSIFPGLGNHDYSNNVDDTYNNNAASRMVQYMYGWLKANAYRVNYDFAEKPYYKFPESRTDYIGSLSYSFNIGSVHIVQLQNFPSYSDEWNSWNVENARRDFYYIRPSFYWLRNDLAVARNRGDVIIIFLHDYHDNFVTDLEKFNKILQEYSVSAVFAGHIHSNCGKIGDITGTNIPLFRSGAASYQDYLIADIDTYNNKMTITKMYCPLDGNYAAGDTWTANLDAIIPNPPLEVPPKEGWVRFINKGGFEAKFRVKWTDEAGVEHVEETGTMLLHNEKIYYLSPNAINVHVAGWENTGLVWEGWRTVFDVNLPCPPNMCYRLTGTTLNPGWNNDC